MEKSGFLLKRSECVLDDKGDDWLWAFGKKRSYLFINFTSSAVYSRSASLRIIRRLHPKYVHAMNNLGNILKERQELMEAEELLSTAVHIQ